MARATTILRLLAAAIAATVTAFAGAMPAHAAEPVEGDGYTIRLGGTGKCLNVKDASTADLAVVQMYTCSLDWNNQWIFKREGTIYNKTAYRIEARAATGKCLDVRDASVDDWAQMQIFTCGPQWNQLFFLEDGFGGSVKLEAVYTDQPPREPRCVTAVTSGPVEDLNLARTYACTSRFAQYQDFYLEQAR